MSMNLSIKRDGTSGADWPNALDRMDRMPPHVRQLMKRLPLDYSVRNVFENFKDCAHLPVPDQIRTVARGYVDDMVARTIRTYGPDHPDATPSAYRPGRPR